MLDGSPGGYDVYDLVRGGSVLASVAVDGAVARIGGISPLAKDLWTARRLHYRHVVGE
jgi:hypothetical protein